MMQGLRAVPYREEPWRSRYPELATILDDEPWAPVGNVLRRNVVHGGTWLSTPGHDGSLLALEDNLEVAAGTPFVDAESLGLDTASLALVHQRVPGFEPIPFDEIGLRVDEYRRSLPTRR
jgi:hypothetical protein